MTISSDQNALEQLCDLTARLNGDERRAREILQLNGVQLPETKKTVPHGILEKQEHRPPAATGVSELEEMMLAVICEAGLPEPEREVEYAAHLGRNWRADFLWKRGRVILEVDGAAHRTKERFAPDLEKANIAQILGYVYLRVGRQHIQNGRAIAWLQEALERRDQQ